jgi:ligand-binding sensor domain-containing protein
MGGSCWTILQRSVAVAHVLLFCVIIPSPHSAIAQERTFQFTNLTVEHGLPSNLITCLIQDARGFIWLGTSGGLVRFDGRMVKVSKSDPNDSVSIPGNLVSALAATKSGNVWIGTADGDVAEIHLPEETIRRINVQHEGTSRVNAIVCRNNGDVWIGTRGNGIFVIAEDGRVSRHLMQFNSNNFNIRDGVVLAMESLPDGRMLVGTHSGLHILDSAGLMLKTFRHTQHTGSLSNDTVRAIAADGDGGVWVGTNNGLNRLDLRTGAFLRYFHDRNDSRSISDDVISSVHVGEGPCVWVGTETRGLNKFDPATGRAIRLSHSGDQPKSLAGNFVFDIHTDWTNTAWVATDLGLSRISARALRVSSFVLDNHTATFVSAVAQDPKGRVWIGSKGIRQLNV